MSKPASSIQQIFTVPYDFCTKSKPRIAISLVIETAILAIGILALIQVVPEVGLFGVIPTAVGGALLVLTIALTIYRSCKDPKSPSPVPHLNRVEKPFDTIQINEGDAAPNPKAAPVPMDIVIRAAYVSPLPPPPDWTEAEVLLLQGRLLEKLELSDVDALLARSKEIYGLFSKMTCHLMSGSGEYDIEYATDTLYLLYCKDEEIFKLEVDDKTKEVTKHDKSGKYDAQQKLALYKRLLYTIMRKENQWKEAWKDSFITAGTIEQILRSPDNKKRLGNLLYS